MLNKVRGIQELVQGVTGYPFQAAGGCVRDALWGVIPKDFDVVLCPGNLSEPEAFGMIKQFAYNFRRLGWRVEVYQAYGIRVQGGDFDNIGSFETMFYACLKVTQEHTGLIIDCLLSRYPDIAEHIKNHDCNANMVYLDLNQQVVGCIRPDTLEFRAGIDSGRIQYMTEKYKLIQVVGNAKS